MNDQYKPGKVNWMSPAEMRNAMTPAQLSPRERRAQIDDFNSRHYAQSSIPASLAPSTSSQSESPLVEALRLTTGDRQSSYGHPLQDFSRTAGLWNSLLMEKLKKPLTPEDVAMAMICLKLSREQNKPKRDNLVDIAGYVNCLQMVIDQKKANEDA